MRFLRKTPNSTRYSDTDVKEAEILEAYTCWLKNEKLSRKQKGLLKNIQGSTQLHRVKDLIDFAHYRFQETESVTPRVGSKERVVEKLMEAIKSGTQQIGAVPQPAYSPEAMGNVDTDVLPNSLKPPTEEELRHWKNPEGTEKVETRTLAHLNLSFEIQDDEVSITDLGSPTPTYVGGIRVNDAAPIQEGTEFKCGEITFQIVDIEPS